MNSPWSRLPAVLLLVAFSAAGPCAVDAAPEPEPVDVEPSATEMFVLEEFAVTGSLIKRTEFEGPSPLRVVSRADIELIAGTGLADVLRNISEATAFEVNDGTSNAAVRGANALDLRALGASNTLILVDGRRLAPNGIDNNGAVFVDLNRFPTGMIERVEILKDGASAVYGADATAGVVNIILRKGFKGAEFSARYGNYLKTDGAETSWSLIAGGERGRARAMIGLTYSTRNAIAATDLPLTANADQTEIWRALDPVKYAARLQPTQFATSSFDYRSPAGPFASVAVPSVPQLSHPSNGLTVAAIRNPLTGVTSTFLPGTGGVPQGTLGNPGNLASVPRVNNSGRPTPAQFVPRSFAAGDSSNLFNYQPFVWNTSETERRGVSADFGFEIGPQLDFYGTLSWVRLDTETHLAPSPLGTPFDNAILVPASNYYNPFGIPLTFTYRPIEVGPRIANIRSESIGAVLGLRGTLARRFDWDLGWSFSNNETSDLTSNAVSESRVRAALARSTPDALNIFGGPDFQNDPATIEGIKIVTGPSGNASTALADLRVTTTELFTLPTGNVGASVAFEHRLERFNVTNDEFSSTLDDVIGASRRPGPTHSRRDVQSGAVELRLPLVTEGRLRWLHTAELSAAARFERFSDGYDSGVKPFVGLRVRVTPHLLLRASHGQVFRSPSLPQLYGGINDQTATGIADFRRPVALTGDAADATTAPRLVRTGGNDRLQPEDGTTRQAGLVFDVPWKPLAGLSLEFTHGRIEQENVISGGLGNLFIRQNELSGTGDLVFREPGTQNFTNTTASPINVLSGPAGAMTAIQPGQNTTVPGRIIMILDAALNLSRQEVTYSDFGLHYRRTTDRHGSFAISSNWTYYESFKFRRLETSPDANNVGRSMPRVRGQTWITWRGGEWGANLGMDYMHRYRDLVLDGWEVDRYHTFSAGVSREFSKESLLRGATVSLGIENLMDREPPPEGNGSFYNQGFIGRPAGRFVHVSVRRAF
jgi:iron complex outermembrane receptor protein